MKALTGLRRGELLALRWRYVDLGTGEVQVVESLERRRDGSQHFKVPKTEKSARLVILPASVVDALSIHRTQQIAYRTELGLSGEPDLVFCEPDGTPWDPDRFSSARSGWPRVTPPANSRLKRSSVIAALCATISSTISTTMTTADFIMMPPSNVPPDDD